jgi:mono/diheme cytochrome c family protein
MKVLVRTRRTLKNGASMAVYALIGTMTLVGCGSPNNNATPSSAPATVNGVVSSEAALSGTVSLKDASQPALERMSSIGSDGSFSVDASGLTPPYLLKAESKDAAGTTTRMYSGATEAGRANINPITSAAVAAATSGTSDDAYEHADHEGRSSTVKSFESLVQALQSQLKPLFDLYGVPADPFTDAGPDASLRAMLKDVRIAVDDGKVVVKNVATGAVIFSGPLSNLASGTFTPANMPAGPGTTPTPTPTPIDGAALYAQNCASCHGPLATSTKLGRTAAQITAANMTRGLSPAQIDAIAAALAPTTPTPPAACTYAYSNWGACQSNGTQTRTVTSSTPAGCTGTPALSQACTYVPPVTTCSSFTYSTWGACQPDGTQTHTVIASSPTGCTGGTPSLSQACTYVPPVTTCSSFTYSTWGACQSNGTQTRTVATSSPAGCTGGTPAALSQTCTYVPPVTTCSSFTYSAWGACQPNGTQTRTVATSSPAGCTGGTPAALSQACTYTPPVDGAALYASSCAGCHGALASSNLKGKGISLALIKSFGMTQGLSDAQLQAIVTAVGP